MGYEIAGGLGVKLAAPEREVYVLVGDGSYLMLPGELVTAVEQGLKLTIVLVDSGGYKSIGSLSRSLGTGGFGTQRAVPVDLAANAESLGARVLRATTIPDLREALEEAKSESRTTVIAIAVDPDEGVPDYESWWDVPVAEVSEAASVREARKAYVEARAAQRRFLGP
jgi:3D-(3,5/4)-trihydroxycyclohexane-1,2-dione acylhydrolase (decyclizing)